MNILEFLLEQLEKQSLYVVIVENRVRFYYLYDPEDAHFFNFETPFEKIIDVTYIIKWLYNNKHIRPPLTLYWSHIRHLEEDPIELPMDDRRVGGILADVGNKILDLPEFAHYREDSFCSVSAHKLKF